MIQVHMFVRLLPQYRTRSVSVLGTSSRQCLVCAPGVSLAFDHPSSTGDLALCRLRCSGTSHMVVVVGIITSTTTGFFSS
ncbi:hypothetical protein LX32DRAFT_263054 [Colletotrichum zoysiae]|uniref:Uncharacterized protein n=1 Tax=Colletotrichum zoysiae TaxID=1216348 RepID=A0AAD9M798_9PEZI|nr:hypothetical protein LX32DRAFT_263054 [Colletotrichum zoysiae]